MSTKIYLAGPMTGYDGDNEQLFNETAAKLRARGFDVLNPAELGMNVPGFKHGDYLLRDLNAAWDQCGALALIENWPLSGGVAMEWLLAKLNQWPIYDVDYLLEEGAGSNGELPEPVEMLIDKPAFHQIIKRFRDGEYDAVEVVS